MKSIPELYNDFLALTKDPQAAATLVLAHMTGSGNTSQTIRIKGEEGNLTAAEAAKYLGISANMIYDLCSSGQLRHHRIGRALRIQPSDLDAFKKGAAKGVRDTRLRCLR